MGLYHQHITDRQLDKNEEGRAKKISKLEKQEERETREKELVKTRSDEREKFITGTRRNQRRWALGQQKKRWTREEVPVCRLAERRDLAEAAVQSIGYGHKCCDLPVESVGFSSPSLLEILGNPWPFETERSNREQERNSCGWHSGSL